MAIQFPDFDRITFDQANPFLTGFQKGQQIGQSAMMFPQDMRAKMLANQIAQVKAQYAQPMAQQALTKANLENQYYGPNIESEMALRKAQGGLFGSEAQKNQFLIHNPQYISPEGMLISQALGKQGGGGGAGAPSMQDGSNDSSGAQGNSMTPPQDTSGGSSQAAQQQSPVQQLASSINATQQNTGKPQYSKSQYSPDALAFNPPVLPSPTGNPATDNMYFKKFGMSPLVQAQVDLAKTNAEKYQGENIDRNKQFNNEAQFANQSTIDAHKFLDALDRSSALERGVGGGRTPAATNAAQEMDAYGNSMAASATKLFDEGKAVHKSDIELQQAAKPNRKQNKDVSFDLAQGVIAKNDRMKERQQFYSQGTQLGLKPEIMDAMWNKFETDRPYINSDTKMPNDAYKGTSRDYLNPEMVNSFMNGSTYNPPNQQQLDNANWNANDLKNITTWAKKNNLKPDAFTKQKLFKLARNENIPLSQLKTEFQKMGAL